jgi:hypothetical protein
MKGSSTPPAAGHYGIQGVAGPANHPGARAGASAWSDAAGRLWLFGGFGMEGDQAGEPEAGSLSDAWSFNPATGDWTWEAGPPTLRQPEIHAASGVPAPANRPGARTGAAAWFQPKTGAWIFGGSFTGTSGATEPLNDQWLLLDAGVNAARGWDRYR